MRILNKTRISTEIERQGYPKRKRTMRILSMVNKSKNTPCMPQAIRGKSKDFNDRGTLDKEKINKRMEKFGVDPNDILERGRTSNEAEMGR